MDVQTLNKKRKEAMYVILFSAVIFGIIIGLLISTQNELMTSIALGLGLIFAVFFARGYAKVAKADTDTLRHIFRKLDK